MRNYNLTEQQTEKLNDALNGYMQREFYDFGYDAQSAYTEDNGIIHLAYTEYNDGEQYYNDLPYYAIQVDYDLNKMAYIYYLSLCDALFDGSEKIIIQPMPIDEFVDDLCNADFEDFIRV